MFDALDLRGIRTGNVQNFTLFDHARRGGAEGPFQRFGLGGQESSGRARTMPRYHGTAVHTSRGGPGKAL